MSFILKKVELNNIRIHEHFIFEPIELGITAISGENGSGKSTIVDSLAWCLYGTRVNNMRNKTLIREGVNPKEKSVNVKVVLLSGGIEYHIERKILNESGQTECNVWGKLEDTDELTLIAGPAVSHVEAFIRQTLSMNEKGFLTSVLIQQKQVDQIVSASPRERGEVIEKLTGIASITQAVSMANEENRTLQKAALLMHTGNLEEAEEKVKKQKEKYDTLSDKEEKLGEEFKSLKESFSTESKMLASQSEKRKKSNILSQEMKNLADKNSFLQEQSDKDIELISAYKKKYGTITIVDLAALKTERNKKQAEVNTIFNKINTNKAFIDKQRQTLSKNETLLPIDELKPNCEKLENDLKLKSTLRDELDTDRRVIMAEVKRAKTSLENFTEDDKHCPVCKHEIGDPIELKAEIQREIDSFNKELKDKKASLLTIENEIAELKVEISKVKEEIEALLVADEINKSIVEHENENTALTEKHFVADQELKTLEKDYEINLKIEADKNTIEAAKERALSTSTIIAKNNERINEIKEQLGEINSITDAKFEKLERDVKSLQVKLTNLSIKGKELQATKKLEKERLGDYENNLDEVKKTLDRYNEIANRIKVLSSSISVMSEFKRNRIEYAIPTLEFYASDILTKFTGGKFTKLSLDERFNTTVTTASGAVRPIAQLSGGELSSAAIALRLGIALLLNSNERNALIFDEVLVSMDEDRARQIMETVSSITNCQVIFIAHNTDINSVADKVVQVVSKQEVEDVA